MRGWQLWLVAAFVPGGLALVALELYRRRRGAHMSDAWLQAQARTEQGQGVDGVCWRWPYDINRDEHGIWNRSIERRRKAS